MGKEVYMAVYDQLGATACRILVPGYSEIYPVEDLIWDNTNKALLFRADILNLHRLDDASLEALLDRLENSELDEYVGHRHPDRHRVRREHRLGPADRARTEAADSPGARAIRGSA